ncbi:hypothetical protein Tco_1367373 [Tanacetum coccineum]
MLAIKIFSERKKVFKERKKYEKIRAKRSKFRADDGSKDVNPFSGGNPLLTKETESEPIIWDRGDEEEEYPFVNEYLSFKEEPIMFVEDESCPVYDMDNEEDEDGDEEEVVYTDNEEESEVIYDIDGNDVDNSPEFKLLHPDQGELLVIQQVLSVAPSKSIDDNSCRRNYIFRTKCTSKYKVCKMIIDRGSCENVVSTYMVEKLEKIMDHPDPYELIWLRKGNTSRSRPVLLYVRELDARGGRGIKCGSWSKGRFEAKLEDEKMMKEMDDGFVREVEVIHFGKRMMVLKWMKKDEENEDDEDDSENWVIK